jgi:hypothetical protein
MPRNHVLNARERFGIGRIHLDRESAVGHTQMRGANFEHDVADAFAQGYLAAMREVLAELGEVARGIRGLNVRCAVQEGCGVVN